MQTKAEEKRKGYCCVVWSERPLTKDMLQSLEQRSTSGQDVDETGEACIEVSLSYFFLYYTAANFCKMLNFLEQVSA